MTLEVLLDLRAAHRHAVMLDHVRLLRADALLRRVVTRLAAGKLPSGLTGERRRGKHRQDREGRGDHQGSAHQLPLFEDPAATDAAALCGQGTRYFHTHPTP
jgi:hypothetical protein